MLAHPHYKICFALDKSCMFRVTSPHPRRPRETFEHHVKPLALIWRNCAVGGRWHARNTLHVDDLQVGSPPPARSVGRSVVVVVVGTSGPRAAPSPSRVIRREGATTAVQRRPSLKRPGATPTPDDGGVADASRLARVAAIRGAVERCCMARLEACGDATACWLSKLVGRFGVKANADANVTSSSGTSSATRVAVIAVDGRVDNGSGCSNDRGATSSRLRPTCWSLRVYADEPWAEVRYR